MPVVLYKRRLADLHKPFLAHDSIYAEHDTICLSVYLSITHVDQLKTVEER